MPESASAAKGNHEPKKQSVRVSSPETSIAAPSREVETPIASAQPLSARQLLQLQRTVGNKAVGELLRKQSKTAEPTLRTSANVIQPAGEAAPAKKPEVSAPTSVAPLAPDAENGGTPNSDIMATDAEKANPVLALKTYREAVGVHLREGKRHKFKIDRYKAFLQADYVHVKTEIPKLIAEDKSLKVQEAIKNQPAKAVKKLKSQRDELEKRRKLLGGDQMLQTEALAEARVQKAYSAGVVAESELPIIEYAYDTLVKMRHDDREASAHGRFFGSGNPYERVRYYEDKLAKAKLVAESTVSYVSEKAKATNRKDIPVFEAHIAKQKLRIAAIEKAKEDLVKAQTLRGQAKLSEDVMAVKRKQLKVEKAAVKGGAGRGVTLGTHLGAKVETAVYGAVVSTLTVGMVELDQSKTDGGYASKREKVTMLDTWKRDWAQLKSVWTTRPYGKLTALHLFFQGLGNLILKPLRKMFTAAALIFTGLSLIPPLAPITGPLAAFCTLVTLGLVAAKAALDTLLATWSALTLALNKNAHNTDVLRSQAVGQAADVAAGAVAIGAAFAVPAIGNAAGGSYVNPLQNVSGHGGDIMSFDPGKAGAPELSKDIGGFFAHQAQAQGAKLPSTIGMIVGEKTVGAIAELEGIGPGAKALFKARQGQIMARNLPGPESYLESLKAAQEVLMGEKIRKTRRVDFLQAEQPVNQESLAKARASLAKIEVYLEETKAKIAASSKGSSAPLATPSTPTTARNIDSFDRSTTAIPAQGQFAARTNPEVEKERAIRAASTAALAARAKSQVQALVGSVGESRSQGAQVASGAQAATSGVSSAPPASVQPADAPNANAAQENVSAGQDILQQVLAVAEAAPEAVDEAITPAPVPAS
jgi:hypothetical protein